MNNTHGHTTKYEIVSCGVDWITATARGTKASRSFDAIGETILRRDADQGHTVSRESRLGFVGYVSPHFFIGHRGRERMIQATSSRANALASDIVESASNISRLDAQVTVYTGDERPNLALHGYRHLTSHRSPSGRKSRLTIIQSQPEGDALLIGSRRSDYYARLYDKGVESETAPARTLWRYEVEAKRQAAVALARAVACSPVDATLVAGFVHRWFSGKGLEPFYSSAGLGQLGLFSIDRRDQDALRWFRSTVSRAIKKAAARYGWAAVLDSLELSDSLNQESRKEDDTNADTVRPVSHNARRTPPRADHTERFLFPHEG